MDWKKLIELIVPVVMASDPKTARLVPYVVTGIQEAESLHVASSAEKLAHAVNLTKIGVDATNAAAGKAVIDAATANTAIASGISTAVAVANLIHQKADKADPTSAPV